MKKHLSLFFLSSAFLLASCAGKTPQADLTLEERLKNPLFTERYAEEMVGRMVDLEMRKDPILENERMKKFVDYTRTKWLSEAKEAKKEQRKGIYGPWLTIGEEVRGEVLYLNDTLFFSTTFDTPPGPSLHVFLSTVTDPRQGPFPDETSIDLGELPSPYGAQAIPVPKDESWETYQTAVLWDTKIQRLYSFAQLQQQP
ncbi:MAG: DM13 domain-containing protein [Candidatus Peribacteraceae bacterium]|nr:DM13 domain-containing protein [Candidatus Peribacteraceae bacterium]